MAEDVLFRWAVICFAAVWGAIVGRVFAVEADDRRTAVFAAAYCGAGAGLVSGPPFAFVFTLIAKLSSSQSGFPALLDAIEATGAALLWGTVGGAAGGLTLGILVVMLGGGRRSAS